MGHVSSGVLWRVLGVGLIAGHGDVEFFSAVCEVCGFVFSVSAIVNSAVLFCDLDEFSGLSGCLCDEFFEGFPFGGVFYTCDGDCDVWHGVGPFVGWFRLGFCGRLLGFCQLSVSALRGENGTSILPPRFVCRCQLLIGVSCWAAPVRAHRLR